MSRLAGIIVVAISLLVLVLAKFSGMPVHLDYFCGSLLPFSSENDKLARGYFPGRSGNIILLNEQVCGRFLPNYCKKNSDDYYFHSEITPSCQ